MERGSKFVNGRTFGTKNNYLAVAAAFAGIFWMISPVAARVQRPSQSPPFAQDEFSVATKNATGSAISRAAYAIAPGDLLDVYVVGVPELSRNYRVDPFGQITLPMLDHPIAAQGLTPAELAKAIGGALREQGLISHPDVLVSVESSPSNSIAVTGSVAKPGVYPVFSATSVVDVISRAGGLTPDAGNLAIVMRGQKAMKLLETSGSGRGVNRSLAPHRTVEIPIRRLLDTGDEGENLPIYPGDAIDVPQAGVVYVVGAVNRAGGFALTGEQGQITVLQAIALAGNATHTAMLKNAVIIRTNSANSSGREQIRIDLEKILAGKAPDRELVAGDILFVPDSTGKEVLAHALAAATGIAIYRVPL